jgi:hypothetical protein
MGTEKQRKNNIQELKNYFIEADKKGIGLDRKKLISCCCLDWGYTERKVKEYLNILLNAGFVVEDEFGLWLKDKSYVMQEIADADATLRNFNDKKMQEMRKDTA